ncbi:MAG: LCP family protein [Acidimicrobiales bacterium]
MASGRPPGDAPDPAAGRRRGSPSYEQGLRSLGTQIGGAGSGAPVANERGLRALGDKIDSAGARSGRTGARKSGKPKWSRKNKVLGGIAAALAVILLVAAGSYGYLQYRFDQFSKVHVAALDQPISGQPFNMLVIGSDSRVGLSGAQAAQAGSAAEVQGQRSDVVMIWHVDPASKQISITSIPRDTLVQMVGQNVSSEGQFNRINASFGNGPNGLVQTIEANFGIPINHVIQVDFGGLEGAVSALGGIYLDFPYPAKDVWSGLNIPTAGCQLIDGTQALAVARSRHYQYYENGYWQYDGTSDFGRIQRQGAFLRALINAAKGKYNPLTINSFLSSLPQGIVIDDQFSLNELIGLAAAFHSFSSSALLTQTLPTISDGYVSPWGDVLFVDQPAAQQMLVDTFGSQLTTPTDPPPDTNLVATPPPVVSPSPASTPSATPGSTAAAAPAPHATEAALRTSAGFGSAAGTLSVATTTVTSPPPPSFDPVPCSPS